MLSNLLLFGPFLLVYYFLGLAENKKPHHPIGSILIPKFIKVAIIIGYTVTLLISILMALQYDPENQKTTLESIGLALVSIAALLIFVTPIRKLISHSIHIDSENHIHTISLSLSFLVFVQFVLTAFSLEEISKTSSETGTSILELWSQDIMLALIAFVGVGWLQKRTTRETLSRLGLVRPTFRTFMAGIAFAIFFVIINLVLESIANMTGFGIDPNVDKVTDQVLGPLFNTIPGILTLGLAAALGEELIFRGAMLPRFGLLYTSVLFTLVHANYGLSIATLIVFILALSLGILRKRFSTTLTMVTHASYNIILGLLTLLGSHIK